MSDFVTAVEICAELRISERAFLKLVEAGKFPQPLRLGRKRVWLRKVVLLDIEQAAEQPKETKEHA